eukprot:GHVU01215825.1.p1 GENE.GHVU01215825.1~~GHVU01215825.1.p1  ORF type:complete len:278 (-),score=62.95 GHVU01215825.1:1417-2250(-)
MGCLLCSPKKPQQGAADKRVSVISKISKVSKKEQRHSIVPTEHSVAGKTFLQVEKYIVGQIIGPKGAVLRGIQDRTGATVTITDASETLSNVKFDGSTPATIAAAFKEVQRIVEAARNPDYEGKEGKKLREEAQKWAKERGRLFEEANKCYQQDKGKAAALREQAKAAGKKMEEANMKAAKAIFNHQNPPNAADAGGKIDLHGLRVEEAITILKERLEMIRKQQQQLKEVEVIAGAGHHSEGAALLRPKVNETLREMKMPFNEAMPGTFMVQLVAAA